MTHLQMSSSPRCTWLWAADQTTLTLASGISPGRPATRHGKPLPNVYDIDTGVDAYTACERLAEAGWTFSWHPSQHPLNRDGWQAGLPGMDQQHVGTHIWLNEGRTDKNGPVYYRTIDVQHGLAAHVGSVDFWSCTTCQLAYLGKISLIDEIKRQGLGTWLIEQLRIDTFGYRWSTTAQGSGSKGFWRHIQRSHPGEYSGGDGSKVCAHIKADL